MQLRVVAGVPGPDPGGEPPRDRGSKPRGRRGTGPAHRSLRQGRAGAEGRRRPRRGGTPPARRGPDANRSRRGRPRRARLCQLLNLDPSTRLRPVEGWGSAGALVPPRSRSRSCFATCTRATAGTRRPPGRSAAVDLPVVAREGAAVLAERGPRLQAPAGSAWGATW